MGLSFRRPLIELVKRGIKTQTRRVMHPGDELITLPNGALQVKSHGRVKWQTGKKYAIVPGRGLSGEGFITLSNIRAEAPSAISAADAEAEGFPHPAVFLWTWANINPDHDFDQPVWVLTFEIASELWPLRDGDVYFGPGPIQGYIPPPERVPQVATSLAEHWQSTAHDGGTLDKKMFDTLEIASGVINAWNREGFLHTDKNGYAVFSNRALVFFYSLGIWLPSQNWNMPPQSLFKVLKP